MSAEQHNFVPTKFFVLHIIRRKIIINSNIKAYQGWWRTMTLGSKEVDRLDPEVDESTLPRVSVLDVTVDGSDWRWCTVDIRWQWLTAFLTLVYHVLTFPVTRR